MEIAPLRFKTFIRNLRDKNIIRVNDFMREFNFTNEKKVVIYLSKKSRVRRITVIKLRNNTILKDFYIMGWKISNELIVHHLKERFGMDEGFAWDNLISNDYTPEFAFLYV